MNIAPQGSLDNPKDAVITGYNVWYRDALANGMAYGHPVPLAVAVQMMQSLHKLKGVKEAKVIRVRYEVLGSDADSINSYFESEALQ